MIKRLSVLWGVVRGDARQLVRAWRHPAAPRWLKPSVLLVGAYVVSPVDLLPDVIPLLGVVDDIVLVPLAMRFLLNRLPAAVRSDIARG
ncbi:MAG: DUF1232 domain-containing protein [Deltaproteobacteria bacterium]|nr:DUF1232 domain-containing protein [Deltaproteobacteria bacterium]